MRLPSYTLLLASALVLATGCAPAKQLRPAPKSGEHSQAPSGHGDMPVWRLEEVAQSSRPLALLRSPSGKLSVLTAARARLIHGAALKIVAAAGEGETPDWLLVGTPTVNAFASYDKGRPLIGITLGMVHLLEDDEGAWGALIGHELAHFRLGHHAAQRSRSQAVEVGSSLAGMLLAAVGLGFGSMAADAAGTLVERSFSRDDESAADRAGVAYLRQAGLDPYGALRLQQRLLEVDSQSAFGFLDSHPSGSDRVEAIRRLLEQPQAVP